MVLAQGYVQKVPKQRDRFYVRHVELFPFLKGRHAEIIDDRHYYRACRNDIYPPIGGEHGRRSFARNTTNNLPTEVNTAIL